MKEIEIIAKFTERNGGTMRKNVLHSIPQLKGGDGF